MTVQIVRDWVECFNAQGPEGLFNVKAPGKRPHRTKEKDHPAVGTTRNPAIRAA